VVDTLAAEHLLGSRSGMRFSYQRFRFPDTRALSLFPFLIWRAGGDGEGRFIRSLY
jgi:hypothetical protein